MNLAWWINLVMSTVAAGALGFCVGAISSLRNRCTALEKRVGRLERHLIDTAKKDSDDG